METYETRGSGWVGFAGVMIAIAGVLNVIYGIAAIDDSAFFTGEQRFVIFDDLNTWGWIHLVIGAVQFFAAFAIWNRHMWGRVIGVLTAGASAVVALLFIAATPFGAFGIFVIDLLVIYGLVVYGGQPRTA